jgi:hypothetical protein
MKSEFFGYVVAASYKARLFQRDFFNDVIAILALLMRQKCSRNSGPLSNCLHLLIFLLLVFMGN